MKLNFDLIRQILEKIESNANGLNSISSSSLFMPGSDEALGASQEQIDYHIQVLVDDRAVVIATLGPGNTYCIPGMIMIDRLSAEGHRVLEAMRNDTIWNKIKDTAIGLGKEGVKQIPGLAIKLLLAP